MANEFAPNPELKYWLAFLKLPKVGPVRLRKILRYFGSLKIAWSGEAMDFIAAGVEEDIVLGMLSKRQEINLEQLLEQMKQENIHAVTLEDKFYPKLLREIYNPPPVIFFKGTLNLEADEFSLGVVGTRKYSPYGARVTPEIVRELTNKGLVIVSGLALGIDSMVHEATLEVKGRTIAVLGSGLDSKNIYPAFNKYLSEKIVANDGLLVSEYAPGTEPLKGNFPQRNRIISGLSLGILVIEAPESSGALLTARFALEQNREVFAIPGSIYSANSFGPNNLIRMGAKLVTGADDILEALNLNLVKEFVMTKKIVPDSLEEAKILENLSGEPIHVDELVRLTKLDTALLNSTLTLMEMKGRVRNLGSMMYVVK
ncbi:MAG TPA: DNA-processing protein DprA [bacterium]|nr:DNA-processing protein DprA [bacterium]